MRSAALISALLLALIVTVNAVPYPYPIEGSWFADRYTSQDWGLALDEFGSQGGSIVWQRGRTLRPRDYGDLLRDPDMQWCYTPGFTDPTNVITCQQWAQEVFASRNATIANWLYYDYNEAYGFSIIACPEIELRINTSRIYWILVLPNATNQNACELSAGDAANVLIVYFNGIDSKEILLAEADKRNMQVYLGSPGLPILDDAPWTVNPALLPAFYEFNRRVLSDYSVRHGPHPSFRGIYQILELSLAGDIAAEIIPSYAAISDALRSIIPGKRFVLSPFEDVLASEPFNNTVATHVHNLKQLVRATKADVIAVQEGRGVGTAAYFWPNQVNTPIGNLDPLLLRLRQYRAPSTPSNITYGQQYIASIRDLFSGYAAAREELAGEGMHFELWANVEAFEYTRYAPCMPLDPVGNGMAELLDRTTKERIDWGIQFEAPFVQHFISFAWDADYLCSAGTGYNQSLAEEIRADFRRPIVAAASFLNGSCSVMSILGFNMIANGALIEFTWTDTAGASMNGTASPFFQDKTYGSRHHMPPLLQEVRAYFPQSAPQAGSWLSVAAITPAGAEAYHPLWLQAGEC